LIRQGDVEGDGGGSEKWLQKLAGQEGFEPPTPGFGVLQQIVEMNNSTYLKHL